MTAYMEKVQGKSATPSEVSESIQIRIHGNHLRVIENGPDMLSVLLTLINNARTSLKLYYYIFSDDASATLVRDALISARLRNVTVTLMVDAFGSSRTHPTFFEPLINAGAHFARFGAKRSTRYLIRNHQKMAIADDTRLLMGGFNIENSYFGAPEDDSWHDLGLFVEGPQVEDMVRWYGQLWRWTATKKQQFRTLRRMIQAWHPNFSHQPPYPLQWLIGGPTERLSPWAQVVKHDLEKAKQVDMVEAYFSPGRGMMKRLAAAATRKGTRLILPTRSDNEATIAAARLLYGPMLRRDIQIYEYQPSKLHMKLIVIDNAVYIGSANFDMRSLFINLELMLKVEDPDFAKSMRNLIDRRMIDSRRITLDLLEKRSILTLFKQVVSYLLVGVLDYTVTRRLNFKTPSEEL